jgi:phosphoglycolate phosphatase-like HAD superfamily hydrolase
MGACRMSLSYEWDEFDAYLFDIDGTLLHCTDAVHYFAFCNVLSRVAGRRVNLDGVTAHGNTDIGILRDAFALAGVNPNAWRPRVAELCDAMCQQVEQERAHLCVNTLPHVRDVLCHLREKGALLSVATGNLERIGKQKLAAAGLLEFFHWGAWSDGFEYREDVFRHAVAQIHACVRANSRRDVAILAFGDTPADIAAARANGIPVVAVATGVYSYERLAGESPELCVHGFTELMEPTRSTTCSNSWAR